MIKLDYQIKTLSPLFTGDDENVGTVSIFRRRTYSIEPKRIESGFKNSALRSAEMLEIIYGIYRDVNKDLKSKHYGMYEQFASYIKNAATSTSRKQFLNRLLFSCGIDTLSEQSGIIVRSGIDKFNDDEFINTIRNEYQYLLVLMREYIKWRGSRAEGLNMDAMSFIEETFADKIGAFENLTEIKSTEQIPHIAGNSIRGLIRRLVMADFVKTVGIQGLKKELYHQLFTGGNLTEKSGIEDIECRERYIRLCPMIGLLGAAIGNMIVQGELNVFNANLQCRELGTGYASFWELLEIDFATRLDSSKTEKDVKIEWNMNETTQMFYQYETIVPGAKFDAKLILATENEMMISAFYHAIKLFKENGMVGGRGAKGNGLIEIDYDIPEDAGKMYTDYLEQNKEEIRAFFEDLGGEKKKK